MVLDGTVVLSGRVDNDKRRLLDLIAEVITLADRAPLVWATDLDASVINGN